MVYNKVNTKGGDEMAVNWWIKKTREALHITQKTLADRSGIPLATIKSIELSTKEPSEKQITNIANALNVDKADISQRFCTDAAIKAAREIKAAAEEQALQAQKIKLSNYLVAKQFDEIVNTILLLSAKNNVSTPFLFPIIDDIKNGCEHTKTVIYAFINSL